MGWRPIKRKMMSIPEFKVTFKVGDMIEGYGTNLLFKITAIGEKRMLLRQQCSNGELRDNENVAMIYHSGAMWRAPS